MSRSSGSTRDKSMANGKLARLTSHRPPTGGRSRKVSTWPQQAGQLQPKSECSRPAPSRRPIWRCCRASSARRRTRSSTAWGSSVAGAPTSIPARLAAGEPVDLVIMAGAGLDRLIGEGKIAAGSRVDLARSGIGVAVRAGAPRPDLSSARRAHSRNHAGQVHRPFVQRQRRLPQGPVPAARAHRHARRPYPAGRGRARGCRGGARRGRDRLPAGERAAARARHRLRRPAAARVAARNGIRSRHRRARPRSPKRRARSSPTSRRRPPRRSSAAAGWSPPDTEVVLRRAQHVSWVERQRRPNKRRGRDLCWVCASLDLTFGVLSAGITALARARHRRFRPPRRAGSAPAPRSTPRSAAPPADPWTRRC